MFPLHHIFKYLLLLILIVSPVFAKNDSGRLLKCLGQEELQIHTRKLEGPVYRLNQRLISEISAAGPIQLKTRFYKQICQNKDFSPSVQLLKVVLINGVSIAHKPELTDIKAQYSHATFLDIVDQAPMLFFSYIAQLQGLAQNPDCLNNKIPELEYFLNRFRYLQEDYSNKELLSDKNKIAKIFERLQSFDKILKSCEVKKVNSKQK